MLISCSGIIWHAKRLSVRGFRLTPECTCFAQCICILRPAGVTLLPMWSFLIICQSHTRWCQTLAAVYFVLNATTCRESGCLSDISLSRIICQGFCPHHAWFTVPLCISWPLRLTSVLQALDCLVSRRYISCHGYLFIEWAISLKPDLFISFITERQCSHEATTYLSSAGIRYWRNGLDKTSLDIMAFKNNSVKYLLQLHIVYVSLRI